MMDYYKMVYKKGNKYYSCGSALKSIPNFLIKTYSFDQYTESDDKDYGLLIFRSKKCSESFYHDWCGSSMNLLDLKLFKCRALKVWEPLNNRIVFNCCSFHNLYLPWPYGTLMAQKVKLVEEIRLCVKLKLMI